MLCSFLFFSASFFSSKSISSYSLSMAAKLSFRLLKTWSFYEWFDCSARDASLILMDSGRVSVNLFVALSDGALLSGVASAVSSMIVRMPFVVIS